MIISIVVPCRNEAAHIAEFLDSVLAQQRDPGQEYEILIADGMSTDGTRDVLARYCSRFANVRMIDNPGKIVSTGLNEAIGHARGEVIVRMDGHTIYAPDYVRQSVRVLQETGADNAGGPWVARGRNWMGDAIAAAFQSKFCAGGGRSHDPAYEGEVDTVYLGCWRRDVFDKAGMFDPELVRNQDDEFNFRLRRLGLRIWQSPRIKSVYTPRDSLKALFRQYSQYGFWKVAVIRKHRGMASPRHAVPALFVASLIFLAVVLAISLGAGWSTVARLAGIVLAIEAAAYALACIGVAAAVPGPIRWKSRFAIPVVIATYQLSYGWGFLTGAVHALRNRRRNGGRPAEFFTALTR
jgi:glycosyltransferase involved in cell wall biosynthesis